MLKPEDRIQYGELIQWCEYVFHRFNGVINPTFKARQILFDVNEHDILAQAMGDVIVFHPFNIMRYYYDVMNVDFSKRDFKSIVLFTIVHELSHLEQDLTWNPEEIPDIHEHIRLVEAANDAYVYSFLMSMLNNNLLDREMFNPYYPSFWDSALTDDAVFEQFVNSYYRIQSPMDKAIFSLAMVSGMNEFDIKKVFEENYFVKLVYIVDDNLRCDVMVKYNNMYSSIDTIMGFIDYIVLNVYNGLDTCFSMNAMVGTLNGMDKGVGIFIRNTSPLKMREIVARLPK